MTWQATRGKRYWLPHAIIGAAEIGLALTTRLERRRPKTRALASVWREIKP